MKNGCFAHSVVPKRDCGCSDGRYYRIFHCSAQSADARALSTREISKLKRQISQTHRRSADRVFHGHALRFFEKRNFMERDLSRVFFVVKNISINIRMMVLHNDRKQM